MWATSRSTTITNKFSVGLWGDDGESGSPYGDWLSYDKCSYIRRSRHCGFHQAKHNNVGENNKKDHVENNGRVSKAEIRDEASNEGITRGSFHQEASFSSGTGQGSFDNSFVFDWSIFVTSCII